MSDTESESSVSELFEETIQTFTVIEELHTEILQKLDVLSNDCSCDITALEEFHRTAMEHIKLTGTSNFGELLLK